MPGGAAPVVSAVVTVHDPPPRMLHRAVGSLLSQTLHREVEVVVVVDDDDAGAEVLAAELQADAGDRRLRVLHPGRVGRGAALNVALDACRGCFVAVQDADDVSHPQRLQRQLAVFRDRDDLQLLGTRVHRTDRLDVLPDWSLPADRAAPVRTIGAEMLITNPIVHSSVLMRRSLLEALGGYSAERRWQYDYDLYLRARRAGAGIGLLQERLVLKQLHPRQHFEHGDATMDRLRSAYRLQRAHVRAEPAPQRYLYWSAVSARFVARVARRSLSSRRRP